jgi:hypothetical protein
MQHGMSLFRDSAHIFIASRAQMDSFSRAHEAAEGGDFNMPAINVQEQGMQQPHVRSTPHSMQHGMYLNPRGPSPMAMPEWG